MVADLPESTYAVLGLIDKVPGSSGYELVSVADRSLAHFWPVSQTLLYRELNRVVDLGWASATRVEQTRVPSKWVYLITADGVRTLESWLARPVPSRETFRSGMLLRLFFAHRMDPGPVQAMLDDYRAALSGQRDEFAALVAKLASMSTPTARMGRLGALHGLRTADARLAWIEEASAELAQADDP